MAGPSLPAPVCRRGRLPTSYRVSGDPATTCEVLLEAGREIGCVATVLADSGVESVNEQVGELVKAGVLNRILALVEVAFSTSMIEACWRSLRHQWLYLHMLDSFNSVKRLIAFGVDQYNTVMPHSAFLGQTPEEIYSGACSSGFRPGDSPW